jgi:hypothetical protein
MVSRLGRCWCCSSPTTARSPPMPPPMPPLMPPPLPELRPRFSGPVSDVAAAAAATETREWEVNEYPRSFLIDVMGEGNDVVTEVDKCLGCCCCCCGGGW